VPHDREFEWENAAEDQPASSNLLPPILGLIGIGLLACATWAFGPASGRLDDELSHCTTITDDRARLACYDQLAVPPQPPAKGAFAPPLTMHVPEESQ